MPTDARFTNATGAPVVDNTNIGVRTRAVRNRTLRGNGACTVP